MANNRPINRRPWRRAPWRKSRRPAIWRDAYSTGLGPTLDPGFPWARLTAPVGGFAVSTLREILAGDVDTATLDKQEVRVDRIVGDLAFFTSSGVDNQLALPPVVRVGLIVEEDPKDRVAAVTVDTYPLWNPTALANLEWMYLEQLMLEENGLESISFETGFRTLSASTHLDIRVKRKLGKADRLWLVMSYANGIEDTGGVTNNWASVVFESHMLRAVLVA